MFFSAREFYDYLQRERWARSDFEDEYGNATKNRVKGYVRAAKAGIVARDCDTSFGNNEYGDEGYIDLYKWYRPWEVVPSLKEFTPPAGDYGIGVEVEMGFVTREAARTVANKIKNWKYVAVDIEGGTYPIEATFPPVLASKLSTKSQVFRYLKLLRDNPELVARHHTDSCVGTHVNVSKGGITNISSTRAYLVGNCIGELDPEQEIKYFGRNPYGGCNDRGGYIEYKLFNSTTDGKALRKYINVAIALTDLITGNEDINYDSLVNSLELGYNK